MIFVFHFKVRSNKVSNLTQKVVLRIERDKIDLKWKKLVSSLIIKNINLLKFNSNAIINTDYGTLECNIGNPVTFSNDLANWILKQRRLLTVKDPSLKKPTSTEHLKRSKAKGVQKKKVTEKKLAKKKKQKIEPIRARIVRG